MKWETKTSKPTFSGSDLSFYTLKKRTNGAAEDNTTTKKQALETQKPLAGMIFSIEF